MDNEDGNEIRNPDATYTDNILGNNEDEDFLYALSLESDPVVKQILEETYRQQKYENRYRDKLNNLLAESKAKEIESKMKMKRYLEKKSKELLSKTPEELERTKKIVEIMRAVETLRFEKNKSKDYEKIKEALKYFDENGFFPFSVFHIINKIRIKPALLEYIDNNLYDDETNDDDYKYEDDGDF